MYLKEQLEQMSDEEQRRLFTGGFYLPQQEKATVYFPTIAPGTGHI